jgi:hypothetical protein
VGTQSASAALEVGIGPFKAKGGYTGTATLTDAGKRRMKVVVTLRRGSASFTQTHMYEPGKVGLKHNSALTRASLKGSFGKVGKIDLTWSTKAKKDGSVGTLPGCAGDRGQGKKGTFSGKFLLNTGDRYFKKIDLKKVQGAIYLENTGSSFCGRAEDRDADVFSRMGSSEDYTGNRHFSLLAARYSSEPSEIIELTLYERAPMFIRHELVLLSRANTIFLDENSPRATVKGVGPFLSGSARFEPANPNCRSFVEGKIDGDLTVKYDSPGPYQPFTSTRTGTYADHRQPTTGC